MPTQQDKIREIQPKSPAAPDPEVTARKIAQFFELCDMAQELAFAGIKYRHPNASPTKLRRLLAERLAVFREGKWRRHG